MKAPKGMISITELARLRNTTTETLRHYDRIGLYKPDWVDPDTGYRYYSFSYFREKVGTILELKELGMPLQEIKDFLTDRNVKKSLAMLERRKKELNEKIKRLTALEKSIEYTIQGTKLLRNNTELGKPYMREQGERNFIVGNTACRTSMELSWECLLLESNVSNSLPFIVMNGCGILKNWIAGQFSDVYYPFLNMAGEIGRVLHEELKENDFSKVTMPEGTYACIRYNGDILNMDESLTKLQSFIEAAGYRICGNLMAFYAVDMMITDREDEIIIELQIPVKQFAMV